MALTLPQRLYLLSYDIDRGRFDPVSTLYRGHLLRAAALTELIMGGWLRDDNGRATRPFARPPEDPFEAELLAGLSPKEPSHWINAVPDHALTAERTVREQLVANGTVTVERGRVLGVIPTRKVVLNHPDQVRLLRERTRDTVLAGHDAAAVPAREAALAVIAAEGDVWTVFTPKERQRHRAALRALQKRFDTEVPAMRNAILTAVVNRRAGNA